MVHGGVGVSSWDQTDGRGLISKWLWASPRWGDMLVKLVKNFFYMTPKIYLNHIETYLDGTWHKGFFKSEWVESVRNIINGHTNDRSMLLLDMIWQLNLIHQSFSIWINAKDFHTDRQTYMTISTRLLILKNNILVCGICHAFFCQLQTFSVCTML